MSNKEKIKSDIAKAIINCLADKPISVSDAAEILKSCHALVSEGTLKAIDEAEAKPLTEALQHLNRSDIKIVSSL